MQAAVEDALATAGDTANARFNPDEIPDLWLVDNDDQAGMAPPVARIIHRRLPVGSDELGNPDLADALEALIALWFYARKQFGKLRDWRRARRDLEEQPTEPGGSPDAT